MASMGDDAKRAKCWSPKEKKPFLQRNLVVKGKEIRRDIMKSSSFVLLPDVLNISKKAILHWLSFKI